MKSNVISNIYWENSSQYHASIYFAHDYDVRANGDVQVFCLSSQQILFGQIVKMCVP